MSIHMQEWLVRRRMERADRDDMPPASRGTSRLHIGMVDGVSTAQTPVITTCWLCTGLVVQRYSNHTILRRRSRLVRHCPN